MNTRQYMRMLGSLLLGLAATLFITNTHAAVTAAFHAGGDCSGPPVTKFRASGEVKVTLCMAIADEAVCGYSLQLEAESTATSGAFQVVKHSAGTNFPDLTMDKIAKPIAITNPPSPNDFGATRDTPAPGVKAGAGQSLVTLTLRPTAKARNAVYEIRLGKNSLVSLGKDNTCLQNSEVPISASIRLNKQK